MTHALHERRITEFSGRKRRYAAFFVFGGAKRP